jgi:hypothetical protein
MTRFTLNPDENQVISLLVPIRFVEGAPSTFWRCLLTAHNTVVEGLDLFHDLPADYAQARSDTDVGEVGQIAALQALEFSHNSFKALFGENLPGTEIKVVDESHGMREGAALVRKFFEASQLDPATLPAAVDIQDSLPLLGGLPEVAGPPNLTFRRLLGVGEESLLGFSKAMLKAMLAT